MFSKVLVANRGEIACRIIRTLDKLDVKSVAVYSEADFAARHVDLAGEAVLIGPAAVDQSYLKIDRIIDAAKKTGAQAIHPGYGLLSENAKFAGACEDAGIVFIGPTPANMRDFGLKHTARAIAAASNVSLLPGTGLLDTVDQAIAAAEAIGYPVILKSTAGGGGIGMRVCRDAKDLRESFDSVKRLGESHFGTAGQYIEKFIELARHVEVQVFGDGEGDAIALGERDCSAQRRNQKVIEETPAPGLKDSTRQELWATAVRLAKAVKYRSAGTVEFVLDATTQAFYFLEVNTRLQVEHPVTEMVHGIDLVEWMVKLAAGELPPLSTLATRKIGHAIEVRLYAEDPGKNFQPSAGVLTEVKFPASVRVDSWVETGTDISPHYDPLLAKVIVHDSDRSRAIAGMRQALAQTRLEGIETNLFYLRDLVRSGPFAAGEIVTKTLATFQYYDPTIDVLSAGNFSTVQDFPGRLGYWDIGVPPSGPMDPLSFRIGNRIVGNHEGAAGLELTINGPTLKFNIPAIICLAGARMRATLDGAPVDYWKAVEVPAGATLKIGAIDGPGCRAYLLVRGGIDVPDYLGSKSTFTLGLFGGHGGRVLRTGDVLHLRTSAETHPLGAAVGVHELEDPEFDGIAEDHIPVFTREWEIGVLDGPHAAPDFFLKEDIETFFGTAWKVHYNSARTGVRLIGPKPKWARKDGGDAGLHPSNIHDVAYAIGAIDYTGDMPIILGPDGPSCGGFVCPAVIVQAELWKIGQLHPGDTVRFVPMSEEDAADAENAQDMGDAIAVSPKPTTGSRDPALLRLAPSPGTPGEGGGEGSFSQASGVGQRKSRSLNQQNPHPALSWSTGREEDNFAGEIPVTYRQAGDKNLLVEYGPMVLDFDLRFRVHALMQRMSESPLPGVIDLTPGIRSLQIHYDNRILPRKDLLEALVKMEHELPATDDMVVKSRIVHLPLSWEDPATLLAIQKYMQSVRDDAPWCPSNLEFIRRVNGLDSIEDVKRVVFDASYLVLALGDVYLGAPVATPIDPRHRLVTTKYNPARLWTAENSVGIGGAYLCIYGMEGPGGYQFVGRTCQMYNRYKVTDDFEPGTPWVLRFFDQIRFYPVSAEELLDFRAKFALGRVKLKIEPTEFSLHNYHEFCRSHAESIEKFRTKQRRAFAEERDRWEAAGEFRAAEAAAEVAAPPSNESIDVPAGAEIIESPMVANVWKVNVTPGQAVKTGDVLVILEAMKMEVNITAPHDGVVNSVVCKPAQMVTPGAALMVLK